MKKISKIIKIYSGFLGCQKSKAFLCIIIFAIALLSLIQIVSATPNSINIQGTLTDSSDAVQTGTFNFSFRIYDNFTSGNKLYETNISVTPDARGVYDVILNNINVNFDKQLYLGVQVDNDAEMTPRGNLTSVPYTFRANTSEDLDKSRSYTVAGLNIIGNLTLAEKITFGLGEIIDNIVDGFIRITGNLNVTQSLIVAGGANISGGVSVNNNINLTASGNIDASGTITADTLQATSQLEVGGGFSQGGLTIAQDGDIITQGNILFSGNVTFVNVSYLSVNGSVNPSLDATFDLGNGSLRWRNANFSGTVQAGSFAGDGSLLTGILSSGNNQTLGQIVGSTTRDYSGNISNGSNIGYIRANLVCLDDFGTGAHMCSNAEIIRTHAESQPVTSGTYWFSVGPPGFTAEANDCSGWTTNVSTSLGPFWNYDLPGRGQGKLTNCGQVKKILCCKS